MHCNGHLNIILNVFKIFALSNTIIYCNSIFQFLHFENILFSMFFFFWKRIATKLSANKVIKKNEWKSRKKYQGSQVRIQLPAAETSAEVSGGGHFCDQRTLSRDSSPLQKGEFKEKKWPFRQECTVPQMNVVLVC